MNNMAISGLKDVKHRDKQTDKGTCCLVFIDAEAGTIPFSA